MSEERALIGDLLGAKQAAEAAGYVVKSATDGVGSMLTALCFPAAQELGELFRDQFKGMRERNAIRMLEKAKVLLDKSPISGDSQASPRIVSEILEHATWCDKDQIQSMWAGLLATAITKNGEDDENLIYVNLLSQLTYSQVLLLDFLCDQADTTVSPVGLLAVRETTFATDKLLEVSGLEDVHKLSFMIERMGSLGLLTQNSGINLVALNFNTLAPSILALSLYARCQGFYGTAIEYFGPPNAGTLSF